MSRQNPESAPSADESARAGVLRAALSGAELTSLDRAILAYLPDIEELVRSTRRPDLPLHESTSSVAMECLLAVAREAQRLSGPPSGDLRAWLLETSARTLGERKGPSPLETASPAATLLIRTDDPDRTAPSRSRPARKGELERWAERLARDLRPPVYAQVLRLRDLDRATWDQIRTEIGATSIEAAKETYRRAHARLRRQLRLLSRQRPPPEH